MLLVNILQVVMLLVYILIESISIFLPNNCLLLINLLLVNLFLPFLLNLPSKVLSHLPLLLFSNSPLSFVFLFFFPQLIFNMSHHLIIFSLNLLLLVLDHRIGKRRHHSFNFVLSLLLLLISFHL